MGNYATVESWASRLGFVVESHHDGYMWHAFDESNQNFCLNAGEVVDRILQRIREEWGGEE